MPKPDALHISSNCLVQNAKRSRKLFDSVWNHSARAPIFCKITKKSVDGKNKKFYRTNRLISAHAYAVATAIAGYRASKVLEADCRDVRVAPDCESSRAPVSGQLSKGAKILLEQFLCGLAQEAATKAHAVRDSMKMKRLSKKTMKIGWDATHEAVFVGSSLMPRTVVVDQLPSRSKVAKGGGGEAEGKDEEYDPEDAGADSADDDITDADPPSEQ